MLVASRLYDAGHTTAAIRLACLQKWKLEHRVFSQFPASIGSEVKLEELKQFLRNKTWHSKPDSAVVQPTPTPRQHGHAGRGLYWFH